MKRSSPLFRRLDGLAAGSGRFNRFALRLSRSLDEALSALPPAKGSGGRKARR